MLSKFDLAPNVTIDALRANYSLFVTELRRLDLIVSSGPIGNRVLNTPMDTGGEKEPGHFSIMSFRNRAQLDSAYDYFLAVADDQSEQRYHSNIQDMTTNQVFVCWEDSEVSS